MTEKVNISEILSYLGISKKNQNYLSFLKVALKKLKEIGKISEEQFNEIETLMNNNLKKEPPRGYRTNFPIFYFNYETQNSKYYEIWGWDATINLYKIQLDKEKGSKEKLYNYTLALIKFFRIVENLEKKNIKFFQNKKFEELAYIIPENFKEILLENELKVLDKIKSFIKKNLRKKYKKSSVKTQKDIEYVYSDKNFKNDEDEHSYEVKVIKKSPKDLEEQLEDDKSFYYNIDQNPEKPTKKDNFERYYQKVAIIKTGLPIKELITTVTLNEVLFVYKNFDNNIQHGKDPEYMVFLGCLILSLNTGISLQEWIKVLLNEKDSPAKLKKQENDILYYEYRNQLTSHYKSKKFIKDITYPINNKIKIFLPDELQYVCRLVLANKKYVKQINISNGFKILNREYPYSFRITENRIKNFFTKYYVDRYGLNSLFADYISLMGDYFFKSSQHYTTININDLNKRYFECYEKLKKDLNYALFNKFKSNKILEIIDDEQYIGSLIVLKKEFIIELKLL